MATSHWNARGIAPALLMVVIATVAGPGPHAAAADLDDLRARAQAVADEIGVMERQYFELLTRQEVLADRIDEASRRLAVLQLQVDQAAEARDIALDRYIERAVDLYKTGPTSDLSFVLTAKDVNDLLMLAKVESNSAAIDEDVLASLAAAETRAQVAQERVDEDKQFLLNAQARADVLAAGISGTLETRRDLFDVLESEIALLEAEARRQASFAARPDAALRDLLAGTGPADGIPPEFAGTGVVLEGTASWYGPGFEGNPTATGAIFDSSLYTAASKELTLNSWLYVEHVGRGVVVLVNDRGPYVADWILDLSRASAQAIGITGIGWVSAEILLKI